MPITLTSTIEDEIEKAHLSVIDLFEIDFGGNLKRRWSTTYVPNEYTINQYTGTSFEPRVISVGRKQWTLGMSNDSLTLDISDGDGEVAKLAIQYGISIFEGAKVKQHRLFPNIREMIENFWEGRGESPEWSEDRIEWEITFGFGNLSQRSLRRIQLNCPHIFARKPDCPYDPANAVGIPDTAVSGVATSGTSSASLYDTSKTFSTTINAGDVVYVYGKGGAAKNIFATVQSVVSDTQLNLTNLKYGYGSEPNMADQLTIPYPYSKSIEAGDGYIAGPPATRCGKTITDCKARGMFGQHKLINNKPYGPGDNRRYFGGMPPTAAVNFSGKIPEGSSDNAGKRFTRKSMGNDSLYGEVIPVIFGYYRIRDVASLYWAPAGDFQHGLFIVSEGEIYDILSPFINERHIDNIRPNLPTHDLIAQHDSFIKWGCWAPSGIEDSRIKDADTCLQVRGAIGRRAGYSFGKHVTLDSYGYGQDYGNPYLFNKGNGDGVSIDGLAVCRIRIETNDDNTDSLTGMFDVLGIMCEVPDGDVSSNVFSKFGVYYVNTPNPIQAAYAFAINPRWGAGISRDKILASSEISESAYCNERIFQAVGSGASLSGNISMSSRHTTNPVGTNYISTTDIDAENGALAGQRITINKGDATKEFTTVISSNHTAKTRKEEYHFTGSYRPNNPDMFGVDAWIDDAFMIIRLEDPFPDDKIPSIGDPFEIEPEKEVRRFTANGPIADDKPAGEVLQQILENCNGTYRYNAGKLEFLIHKALTAAEIDDIDSKYLFTDRGTNRNILRDPDTGLSSLTYWRLSPGEIPNEFNVKFPDQARTYFMTNVQVFNEEAQVQAATVAGEGGDRLKISESVTLNLTTNVDQAARLLALRARMKFMQNLFIRFQTSLKTALPILPGDIIAVDSAIFPSIAPDLSYQDVVSPQGNWLFKVLTKEESKDFVITFECQVHLNFIYDDYCTDFSNFFVSETPNIKAGTAVNVIPQSATETVIVGSGNQLKSEVTVEFAWPTHAWIRTR